MKTHLAPADIGSPPALRQWPGTVCAPSPAQSPKMRFPHMWEENFPLNPFELLWTPLKHVQHHPVKALKMIWFWTLCHFEPTLLFSWRSLGVSWNPVYSNGTPSNPIELMWFWILLNFIFWMCFSRSIIIIHFSFIIYLLFVIVCALFFFINDST